MFDDIGDAVLLIVVCVCVRKSFLSLYGSCYYVVMITVNSVFLVKCVRFVYFVPYSVRKKTEKPQISAVFDRF